MGADRMVKGIPPKSPGDKRDGVNCLVIIKNPPHTEIPTFLMKLDSANIHVLAYVFLEYLSVIGQRTSICKSRGPI